MESEHSEVQEKPKGSSLGVGYIASLVILILFGLLLHQSAFGIFIDGAIGFVAAKFFIDKVGPSTVGIVLTPAVFLGTFFVSAYLLNAVAKYVFGLVFS